MSGTIQYKYDDLGRVTEVTDPNNVKSIFTYDDAGNRTRHQITGSPNPQPPPQAVIVLPLNGFTIIPIE